VLILRRIKPSIFMHFASVAFKGLMVWGARVTGKVVGDEWLVARMESRTKRGEEAKERAPREQGARAVSIRIEG